MINQLGLCLTLFIKYNSECFEQKLLLRCSFRCDQICGNHCCQLFDTVVPLKSDLSVSWLVQTEYYCILCIVGTGISPILLTKWMGFQSILENRSFYVKTSAMDKLQLTGQNLGRVFNFRYGHAVHFICVKVYSVH
jgi:hypothetical protein